MDAAIPERNLYRQAIDCRPWDKVVAFYAACLQCDPKNGGSEMPAFMQGETPVSIQRSYKASAMQTAHVMDATSQQFDPVNVNQEANANVGSHQSNTLLSKAEDDAYNQHLYGITPCDVLKKHWNIKSADAYEPARKHTRTNYCLRLGYVGTSYSGYQRQGGESTPTGGKPDTEEETNHSANSGLHTVEDDILLALGGQTSVAAGRTDKDVSAVSQMICFHTYDDPPRSPEDYLLIAKQSIPCIAGRLRFFDCVTMPRSFHSLFCATWRRYIFLVPLQNYTRCPWIPAPTNASSSCTSTGLSLSESRGVQQVTDPTPLPWLDTATYSKPKYPTWGGEEVPASYDTELGWDIDCAFVDRAARRLEGLTVRCNCFTTSKVVESDVCEFYRSRASVVDITPPRNTCDALSSASKDPAIPALCIELVGSRFLRCMVRIIVATLVREAMRPTADRREDVLLHCVQNENRMLAACAINGKGLSLSGVGYALERATEHGKAGAVGNPAVPKGAGKRRKKDKNTTTTPDEVTEQQLSQRQRRHAGQTSDIA